MRGAVFIAKCLPAALCVLLFVAWLASLWFAMGFATSRTGGDLFVGVIGGRFIFEKDLNGDRSTKWIFRRKNTPYKPAQPRAFYYFHNQYSLSIHFPVPCLITAL